jgi:hypothetical protein
VKGGLNQKDVGTPGVQNLHYVVFNACKLILLVPLSCEFSSN